jgi:hypothetical protein
MSNGLRSTAVIVGVALTMAGCAIGRRHAYHDGNPRLSVRAATLVALAVQDQRNEVASGLKRANFVGFQRGGFGNPFDVTTLSGHSLAADFTVSIRRGLQRAGYRVVAVGVPDQAGPKQVQDLFRGAGAERGIVVEIREWKSDTYNNTALHYGVILRVLDPNGRELAHSSIAGNDSLGGSFFDPAGHAEEAVPRAYNEKLEELLNNPSVQRALAPTPPPAAAPPAAPAPDAAPSVTPVPAS